MHYASGCAFKVPKVVNNATLLGYGVIDRESSLVPRLALLVRIVYSKSAVMGSRVPKGIPDPNLFP